MTIAAILKTWAAIDLHKLITDSKEVEVDIGKRVGANGVPCVIIKYRILSVIVIVIFFYMFMLEFMLVF